MDSNSRIQLYSRAMKAGMISRQDGMKAINQEVDNQWSGKKIDTSFTGQLKGVLNDESNLAKGTAEGIYNGVVNTVKAPIDLGIAGYSKATGNKPMQQAAMQQAKDDFNNSIPG